MIYKFFENHITTILFYLIVTFIFAVVYTTIEYFVDLMISRTPCGLAAGMNGKSKDWKIWFRPFGRNKIGETPCALGTGIVNFKDFLYVFIDQKSDFFGFLVFKMPAQI